MKKLICLLLVLTMLITLTACDKGTDKPDDGAAAQAGALELSSPDVDLTVLSSTMVYSEVNNMRVNPNDYSGKVIKMKGAFTYQVDQATNIEYYSCIIKDATACCAQGIEFVLSGDKKYPDDYPALGSEITVVGNFDTYVEQGYRYCRLNDAVLVTE